MSQGLLSLIATVANFFLPAKYESLVASNGRKTKLKLNSEHMKAMIAVAFIAVYEHEKKNPSITKEEKKSIFVDNIVRTYSAFSPIKNDGAFVPVTEWEVHYDEMPDFARASMGKYMKENGLIVDEDQAFVKEYSAAGYSVGKKILTFKAQQNQRNVIFTLPFDPEEAEEEEEAAIPAVDLCPEECPESSDSEVDECDVKNFKL